MGVTTTTMLSAQLLSDLLMTQDYIKGYSIFIHITTTRILSAQLLSDLEASSRLKTSYWVLILSRDCW